MRENHLAREKRRLAEGREKKGFPYWVFLGVAKTIDGWLFFLVCVFFHVSFNAFSVFFDLLSFPSSSKNGHRKYPLFIFSIDRCAAFCAGGLTEFDSQVLTTNPSFDFFPFRVASNTGSNAVMQIGGRGKLSAPQLC